MLVKLKRNWFGPNGVRYRVRDGLVEVSSDALPHLPSDAEIWASKGSLPDKGTPVMPGYGGKPLHEQALDMVPGAAPVHQIVAARNAPAVVRSPEDLHKLARAQEEIRDREVEDEIPPEKDVLKGLAEAHEAMAKSREAVGDQANADRMRAAAKASASAPSERRIVDQPSKTLRAGSVSAVEVETEDESPLVKVGTRPAEPPSRPPVPTTKPAPEPKK